MGTIYTAVLFPLLLLIGQTLVALGQRKISQRIWEHYAADGYDLGALTKQDVANSTAD